MEQEAEIPTARHSELDSESREQNDQVLPGNGEKKVPHAPFGFLGLSWVYYDPKDPLVPHRVRPIFTILLIITAVAGGFGYHYRDLLANAVTNPRTTTNVSVDEIRKYTIRTLDDSENNLGNFTSIAIGRDGNPVISYYDASIGSRALKFVKCTDPTCANTIIRTLVTNIVDVSFTLTPDIAIGSDGNPIIAYFDWVAAGALKLYTCNDQSCSSGTAQTVQNTIQDVGLYSSIAIGTDGYPVIVYQSDSDDSLTLFKCSNITCTSGTEYILDDPANTVGRFSSVVIGSDGYPVISYYDQTAASLKLYKCNNVACSSGTASTLDDPANSVGGYTSISIGSDGYPVISYFDDTADSLKLYKCNNVACSSGTASTLDDPTNQVGYTTSITVGRDGYPLISYYDLTAGSLNLYKCNNVACTTGSAIVIDDPTNTVGQYTSLVVGRDGYPVISYYDATNKSLKFAYVGAQLQVAQTPEGLIDDGLVGHWTFDGQMTSSTTAYDSSPTHATGTLTNGPARVQGKLGQGIRFSEFDGSYLEIGNSTKIDNSSQGAITAWIYSSDNGLDQSIVGYGGQNEVGTGDHLELLISLTGPLAFEFVDDVNGTNALLGPTLQRNRWYHVAIVSSDTTYAMYVDGQPVSFTGTNNGMWLADVVATDPVMSSIGVVKDDGNIKDIFNGTLDDVRIYNRALSADEIANLYSGTKGSRVGKCGDGPILDQDGNKYGIVEIGTQCRLDRNMNVGTRINGAVAQTNNATTEKYCYSDTDSNCTDDHPKRPDGGLYTWDEAMQYSTSPGARGICPTSWHIPTDAEWYTLENYLKTNGQSCSALRIGDGCSGAGTKIRPGGSVSFEMGNAGWYAGDYYDRNVLGDLWSSSGSGSYATHRIHYASGAGVYRWTNALKVWSYSVRCIKD